MDHHAGRFIYKDKFVILKQNLDRNGFRGKVFDRFFEFLDADFLTDLYRIMRRDRFPVH